MQGLQPRLMQAAAFNYTELLVGRGGLAAGALAFTQHGRTAAASTAAAAANNIIRQIVNQGVAAAVKMESS